MLFFLLFIPPAVSLFSEEGTTTEKCAKKTLAINNYKSSKCSDLGSSDLDKMLFCQTLLPVLELFISDRMEGI